MAGKSRIRRDKNGLSDHDKLFVEAYEPGATVTKAAEAAGVTERTAYNMLARDNVRQAIHRYQTGRIHGELVPQAISTQLKLMRDAKTPAAVKRAVANDVMQTHAPADALAQSQPGGMAEMSITQLQELVTRLEALKEAQMIDVTPTNEADETPIQIDDKSGDPFG